MSYQLMFQKALELQQNGALNEAEKLYRQILETAPDNADVLNLLGLIAQAKGLHEEAAAYFYKAVNTAPNHFPIYFNLAVSLGACEKYAEAAEAYRKVIQLNPQCKEAFYGLGNLDWQQNNLENAAENFAQALKIDANYLEAQTNLAEVRNDIEQLKKIAFNNPTALYYLGRRAFNERNFTEAKNYLSQADTLLESDEIKSMLGETLSALGEKETALKLFYKAENINPCNFTALINLADLEAENKNFDIAEAYYKKALAVDGNSLRAHANYAEMLNRCHRTLEALEEYRQAVIISPQTPELSYNLSLILKSLEEYEQALDLMFHAFYLAPQHADWSLNIAETLVLLNDKAPEKAKKICENWYQKMPDNIVAQHLWAAINHRTPDKDTAYNRLLFDTFAPTYEETLKNINYRVADKIAELYAPLNGKILDLGCGTGLLGAKIKTKNNQLYGVDISPKMLELAREKNIYAELKQQDIIQYLQTEHPDFDCVVAADVFCYFGDLANIFTLCYPTPLIFSAETDEAVKTFELQANGRYKHNLNHLKTLLQNAGYTNIEATKTILRTENKSEVVGHILRCTCIS